MNLSEEEARKLTDRIQNAGTEVVEAKVSGAWDPGALLLEISAGVWLLSCRFGAAAVAPALDCSNASGASDRRKLGQQVIQSMTCAAHVRRRRRISPCSVHRPFANCTRVRKGSATVSTAYAATAVKRSALITEP